MPLKVAIISEKLGTPDAKCTTRIAIEALARNHKVYEAYPADINHIEGQLIANARIYTGAEANEPQEHERINLEEMDVIHFRPNPPVDMAYLTTLYLLDRIKHKVLIINNPESVIRFPEKIFPLDFPEFTPATLISRDINEIREFAERHKEIIIKPLYEFGGRGIKKCKSSEFDAEFIIKWLEESHLPLVSQIFLPRVTEGDKRILFIGGDAAGAFTRIPQTGKYIANFSQGGSIHKTTLTAREQEFAKLLKPKLIEYGIYICGIDVIDTYVTEINITSSGGFSQIEELYGEKLQIKLWDIIEAKIKS